MDPTRAQTTVSGKHYVRHLVNLKFNRCFVKQHTNADPPIKAYMPTMVYTEESDVDLNSLRQTIGNVEVSDSILVHSLLQRKGIDIPNDLKQQLLELICFFNHEDTLSEDLIEERWFSQTSVGKERQRKTWKDGDLAEQLFAEIEPKSVQSYCAIIRGMCKFYQVERGWALFQEAIEKDLPIDVNTYNSVIQVANFLKESGELRWELVQDILRIMATRMVKPNLGTLNAVMGLISTIGGYRQGRTFALQTLAEFQTLGIQPSLATWYFVLSIFCRERGPVSHVLVDILKQIEGKEFKISNAKDTFFFVTAMDVCRNHLSDKDLAKRLNTLLHHGNNYDLIGDSYKESIFYRHYFGLLCATEPLEIFMETYNQLVPNIYTPEPGIMAEILKHVDINGALELVPQLWSDMVVFDHVNRESLLQQVLKIMVDNRPNAELASQIGLDGRFMDIGWQIWQKIENQQEGRTNQLIWTGRMLGDILILCSRCDDIEKANEIFRKLDKEEDKVSGTPGPAALETFVRLCIANKQPTQAIAALQYCVENGLPGNETLAKQITTSMTLDEGHLSKISTLIGGEKLRNKEDTIVT